MRALKLLVVAMGVLLVAGVIALGIAITVRVQRGPSGETAVAPLHLSLPEGAHVIAAELAGDRILVRLMLRDGGDELLLINARTGAKIAIIAASPGAAARP
jgi:hypothetical protein